MSAGQSPGPCRVCGNRENNTAHIAREMMFGTRDAFEYLECGACGCLQIADVPASLAAYYPPSYYSFHAAHEGPLKRFLKRLRASHALGRRSFLGGILAARYGPPPYVAWVKAAGIGPSDAILDVGSGTGRLLVDMSLAGFENVTGVDPYIAHDIAYPRGVRVLKRTLAELDGRYRFIMFHHTFEHLPDPAGTLGAASRLAERDGTVLLRIPVAGCFAWRRYGVNWVQLDAPRHLFLHTERSIRFLARETGFEVAQVRWDSTAFQFWGSEQIARGIPLDDPRSYFRDPKRSIFTPRQILEFESEARALNENGAGDSACFYLRPARDAPS